MYRLSFESIRRHKGHCRPRWSSLELPVAQWWLHCTWNASREYRQFSWSIAQHQRHLGSQRIYLAHHSNTWMNPHICSGNTDFCPILLASGSRLRCYWDFLFVLGSPSRVRSMGGSSRNTTKGQWSLLRHPTKGGPGWRFLWGFECFPSLNPKSSWLLEILVQILSLSDHVWDSSSSTPNH